MPTVKYPNGKSKKFPYTPAGVDAAKAAAKKAGGKITISPDSERKLPPQKRVKSVKKK